MAVTDLSEHLKQQYAAQVEKDLADLKSAYEKNLQGYNDAEAKLPEAYEAARNAAAAQNAIAKHNFDERAAATGLNSGTGGQAELARSSVYQANLANIDRAQTAAQQEIASQKRLLQSEYENAIAGAKANNDAALASALYQELVRQQALGGTGGSSGSSSSGGVVYDTHGLTDAEIRELQRKAGITVDGIWGPQTDEAYNRYINGDFKQALTDSEQLDLRTLINARLKVKDYSGALELLSAYENRMSDQQFDIWANYLDGRIGRERG